MRHAGCEAAWGESKAPKELCVFLEPCFSFDGDDVVPVTGFELIQSILSEEFVGDIDQVGVAVGECIVSIRVLDTVHESEGRTSEDAGAAGIEDESEFTLPCLAVIEVAVFQTKWVGFSVAGLTDSSWVFLPEVTVQ